MNIFKRLARGISKTAKGLGQAAPQLALQALNLGSGGTVGLIASALGISGAGPRDVMSHIEKNPQESLELLMVMEKTKQVEITAMIEDRKHARDQYKAMIASGDPVLAWFLPVLTVMLLCLLAWMFYVLSLPVPEGESISPNVSLIVGALLSSVTSAMAFWYSKGDKDQNAVHMQSKLNNNE